MIVSLVFDGLMAKNNHHHDLISAAGEMARVVPSLFYIVSRFS